jgi:sterol desaturase/sphingolipid hydroxylase (fatty acid hydroxylase superfamily)
MGGRILGVAIGMCVLALVLGYCERRWPAVPSPEKRTKRALATDLGWWAYVATIDRPITAFFTITGVVLALVPFFLLEGVPIDRVSIAQWVKAPTFVSELPAIVSIPIVLLLGDLVGYWAHRAFHRGWLWRVHAVHHSSTRLDWLAAVRGHPLNEILGGIFRALPLLLLGVRPGAVAAIAPFLVLHAIVLHANVRWDYGPLRWIVASPAFHRWHHAADARGCNFAGLFPFIDVLFGTYHLPRGEVPARTGVVGEPVPESWLGQLVHPFRRRRA